MSSNSIDATFNASTMVTDNQIRTTAGAEETAKEPSLVPQHKILVKNPSDRGIYFAPDLNQPSASKKKPIQLPLMFDQPQLRRNKSSFQQEASKDGSSQNRSVISNAIKPDLSLHTKGNRLTLKPDHRYPQLIQRQEAAQHRLRVAAQKHPPAAALEQARLLQQLPQEDRRHRGTGRPQKQKALPSRSEQNPKRVRRQVLHVHKRASHPRALPQAVLRGCSGPHRAAGRLRKARWLHQLEQRHHPSSAAGRRPRKQSRHASLVLPAEHSPAQSALSRHRLHGTASRPAARLPGKIFLGRGLRSRRVSEADFSELQRPRRSPGLQAAHPPRRPARLVLEAAGVPAHREESSAVPADGRHGEQAPVPAVLHDLFGAHHLEHALHPAERDALPQSLRRG